MGRYYTGDIEGKFWFAVQSSSAADRFGVEGNTPNYLDYYFDTENLETVETEIQNIIKNISQENIDKLDNFFKDVDGYNDEIMMKHDILNIWNAYKSEYADLKLGIKIRDCIKEEGSCSFQAEC
jgi:hypothetical protein